MPRRLIFFMIAVAGVLAAQDPPPFAGRLDYTSGSVSFQPAGVTDWVPATVNRPLSVGDQLYVDNGQAEIEVPGTAFRLGSSTAFQFMDLSGQIVQVRLSEGTLNLRVRRLEGNQDIEIDTPNVAFSVNRPGEYRIDTDPDTNETRVTAWYGDGEVTANGAAFQVRPREQAIISGQAQYNVYAAPGYDQFDEWAVSRDRREDRYESSRYVSPYMVGYEDLDEYGSWRAVPSYGEVWVPYHTPVGWAPYHDGHWAWIEPWGWSWVDDEPWGFAPFHYGRWAFADGSWCWLPGPVAVAPVYAPALVAWMNFGSGFGVSFGFGGGPAVGWFPLGPRDVYIPAYHASETYVTRVNVTNTTIINNTTVTNVYNNYVRTGTVSTVVNSVNRTAPGAVVAVPQNALASARPVQQVARPVPVAQIRNIKAVDPAPRVAPQLASVMGHPKPVAAPRPAAAVLSRPIVAKTPPPPAPASFQARQKLLAQNPGHPLPIQQMHQLARTAPAAPAVHPPVRVVARAPQVTPRVINTPPPPRATARGGVVQRPGTPPTGPPVPRPPQPGAVSRVQPQQAQPRPFEPPSAQRQRGQQAPQPNRPAEVQHPVQPPTQANRPFEPPSVQQRRAERAPQPNRPAEVQHAPQPPTRANRPFEPPRVQQHAALPAQPNRPAEVQHAPQPPAQANRPFEPPRVEQRPAPPAQPNRPAEVQHPPQPPAQANRPFEPPRVEQRPAPPAQPNRPAEVQHPPQPPAQAERRPSEPPAQQRQGLTSRVEPNRPYEPPARQHVQPPERRLPVERPSPAEPPRPERSAPPPPQVRPSPPPQPRAVQPPPVQRHESPPPPPREQARPAPAPPQHPAPPPPAEKKKQEPQRG